MQLNGATDPLGPLPGIAAPAAPDGLAIPATYGAIELLNSYAGVFLAAFLVTLLATPLVRKLAIAMEIIDRPDEGRKQHQYPVAYLGGFAVFLGVMAALGYSFVITDEPAGTLAPVPMSIVIGILAITFTGLAADVWGWDPRLKIAGQLVAAAALAVQDIGTRVAEGVLAPFVGDAATVLLTLGPVSIASGDIFYWTGTALIALFVLGGCNAMNLIDGLDGLCSGTAAIMASAPTRRVTPETGRKHGRLSVLLRARHLRETRAPRKDRPCSRPRPSISATLPSSSSRARSSC